jgi:hypothetical protein
MDFKARFEGRKAFISKQSNIGTFLNGEKAQQPKQVVVLRQGSVQKTKDQGQPDSQINRHENQESPRIDLDQWSGLVVENGDDVSPILADNRFRSLSP